MTQLPSTVLEDTVIDPCSYTDRLTYLPGETVTVFVDTADPQVTLGLERMEASPDASPAGGSMVGTPVEWAGTGTVAGRRQASCIGSFMHVPASPAGPSLATATLGMLAWSSRWSTDTPQTLLEVADPATGGALRIQVSNGLLSLTVMADGVEAVSTVDEPLIDDCWYLVAGLVDGGARAVVEPVDRLYGFPGAGATVPVPPGFAVTPGAAVTVAGRGPEAVEYENGVARGRASECFSGKAAAPFLASAALADLGALARGVVDATDAFGDALVAAWDLALRAGDDPNRVRNSVTGERDGLVVNVPVRAVRGPNWSGRCHDFALAPEEYGAIHFHDSDIGDIGWTPTASAALPDDLPSGMYGITVATASGSDVVPIFVPARPEERGNAPVAVLMPTFSYLAYANEQLYNSAIDFASVTDAVIQISEVERARAVDPRMGYSMYDHHNDGSGVPYSSARRPIMNLRFGQDMWLTGAGRALPGDMYLLEWLDRRGIAYEVLTDEVLHVEGREALDPYSVVITGAHPEYHSSAMLDALEGYRDDGGALMYLGGNGFYWVTETYSLDPLVIEVRRGYAGIRSWESLPGEVTLVSTGEPGGLWRHRGRAPQKLVGVGFCAQGWGRSEPYTLGPAAHDEAHKWIFDGVDENPLGDYGLVMGGAAGDELDRVDPALGTPPGAVVLGSSAGHTNFYQRVIEELPMLAPDTTGGQQDPEIKADIVYFETPGGGRVFSTGSIAWSGSLLHNGCDNGVSRVTENVVRAFSSPSSG